MKYTVFILLCMLLASCSFWTNIQKDNENNIEDTVSNNSGAENLPEDNNIDITWEDLIGKIEENTQTEDKGTPITEENTSIVEQTQTDINSEKNTNIEKEVIKKSEDAQLPKILSTIVWNNLKDWISFFKWKNYPKEEQKYGKSKYIIWDKSFLEIPSISDFDYSHTLNADFCIDIYCFQKGSPYELKNSIARFIYFQKGDTSSEYRFAFNLATKEFSWQTVPQGPGQIEYHTKVVIDGKVSEMKWSNGCWWSNFKQITSENISDAPEKFEIGNVTYILQNQNFEGRAYLHNTEGIKKIGSWSSLFTGVNENDLSIHTVSTQLSEIIDRQKVFPVTYYLVFKEIPGVRFHYKATVENPVGIFTTTEDISDGEVKWSILGEMIFNQTAKYKVLSHEDEWYIHLRGKNDSIIYPKGNILKEIFILKKYAQWKYLVYLKDKYSLQSMAEMCKPLVYIYGADNKKMSLKVETNKEAQFTKLIPEFQKENTWEFMANNNKVHFKKDSYDYLYYAVKVPNYTTNEHGWIVEWEDVNQFFQEKLDYIGFNSQEKRDFMEYWVPRYKSGHSYFVSFKFNEELDQYVKLKFNENPDSLFRVLLDSYEITSKHEVPSTFWYENMQKKQDKNLLKKYVRSGKLDIFEWGGVLQTFEQTYIK